VKQCALVALEIAKGLTLSDDRRFWQVKLDVAGAAANGGTLSLFASDNPEGLHAVAEGHAAMALVNPSVMLTLAYRGTGPFRQPLPVRAIAVMPSYDLFAFAVTADTGLTSLEDVRERRYPLRISVRGQRNHSLHPILECVVRAAGFSLDDVMRWGGSIHYEPGFDAPARSGFDSPARLEMARNGTINAIFDEAVCRWLEDAQRIGMRVLPLGATTVRNLERLGFRANVIDKASYPLLEADVETIDFSGFAVFVHADAPDDLVTSICAGLDLHRASIPWEGSGPLPIEHMCRDTPDGPLDVPLHPAAERYWRERGYLDGQTFPSSGQIHPRRVPFERPPRIRSMLTLEIASEIVARADVVAAGGFATRVQLRQQTQDFERWFATIVSAPSRESLASVAGGRADLAIVGPGCELVYGEDAPADVLAAIRAVVETRKDQIAGVCGRV